MKEIEIYFSDLNEDMQKKLLEEAGVESPEDMNWDVFPIAVVPIERMDMGD